MENRSQFKDEFDKCFEKLLCLIDESFSIMDNSPDDKDYLISLWKNRITQFITHTFKTGEKYNNKDVFKAITKTLIFGK